MQWLQKILKLYLILNNNVYKVFLLITDREVVIAGT